MNTYQTCKKMKKKADDKKQSNFRVEGSNNLNYLINQNMERWEFKTLLGENVATILPSGLTAAEHVEKKWGMNRKLLYTGKDTIHQN